MFNVRYLVIAIGGPDEDAVTEEEVDGFHEILSNRFAPITITKLSEKVSNKLTLALLQERDVL